MDENPYKSPEHESESGAKPPKPPSRFTAAVGYGWLSFFGTVFLLGGLEEVALPPDSMVYSTYKVILIFLVASPVGIAMSYWGWRHPESPRALAVAILLAVSWVLRAIFEMYVLGIR